MVGNCVFFVLKIISIFSNFERDVMFEVNLIVCVNDGFCYGIIRVIVKILDVNNNSLDFDELSYMVIIGEDIFFFIFVLWVCVIDKDEGINGGVYYYFIVLLLWFFVDVIIGVVKVVG